MIVLAFIAALLTGAVVGASGVQPLDNTGGPGYTAVAAPTVAPLDNTGGPGY
jgi:hypothetical protein